MTTSRRNRLLDALEAVAGLTMMLWAIAQLSIPLAVGAAGGILFASGMLGLRRRREVN